MTVTAIIQARMGSTRLPGKVLLPLAGRPVLEHVVRRVSAAGEVDAVVAATTDLPEDHVLVDVAGRLGVIAVQGSPNDVLARYRLAAERADSDVIVRITADCPCVDPDVIDRVVRQHYAQDADYTSNVRPRSFPHGLDVEVISRSALDCAHEEAELGVEREHVTPFIWSRPDRFRIANLAAEPQEAAPELRVTLDTAADYLALQALFDLLPQGFECKDLVRIISEHSWLPQINRTEAQKTVHLDRDPASRARAMAIEVASWASRQDLFAAAEILLESLDDRELLARVGEVDAERVLSRLKRYAHD